jgi:hypothetical protein
MDTIMREKKSLILLNSLKRDWQKEDYTCITTKESKRSIVWWRMGIWRMKGIRKKCRNLNFPHMQKGGGIEPHFEM